jgi:hypothetical protein
MTADVRERSHASFFERITLVESITPSTMLAMIDSMTSRLNGYQLVLAPLRKM